MGQTRPLAGQVALVTGGARGIGRGIAARLAEEGARVILWDLGFDAFDATAAGFEPALKQVVDVADYASVEAGVAQAVAALGQVDIMVNNAGINGPVVDMWDYPLDAWHRVIAVNLTGVFHGCRAIVPHMRARGTGRIVNVASIAGKEGVPRIAPYSASKAGVIALTKSLAKELAETRITVNCIAPAITETELFNEMTQDHITAMKAKIPMGRFLTIPEIAAMVAFIAGPDCTFTTGFAFDLTGGRATY
ncbi:SDR family NAD(P)-dependent oxidoreductase [Falsiroseomonas sp. HW251]|uniref:SDR family NAD(P)-dependent oxidoreductase n=1 Tax=Falsiroseomonas sp. HW251 TaxID=3390998 RepID=UPI003D3166E8